MYSRLQASCQLRPAPSSPCRIAPATPVPPAPAPTTTNTWSSKRSLLSCAALSSPASAIAPVPWMSSLKLGTTLR